MKWLLLAGVLLLAGCVTPQYYAQPTNIQYYCYADYWGTTCGYYTLAQIRGLRAHQRYNYYYYPRYYDTRVIVVPAPTPSYKERPTPRPQLAPPGTQAPPVRRAIPRGGG